MRVVIIPTPHSGSMPSVEKRHALEAPQIVSSLYGWGYRGASEVCFWGLGLLGFRATRV